MLASPNTFICNIAVYFVPEFRNKYVTLEWDIMFDAEIRLLAMCSERRYGVREMLENLGGSHTGNMHRLKQLESSGALEYEYTSNGRGRPKKIATLSLLGVTLLDKIRSVNEMMTKVNDNDVNSVKEQLILRKKIIDSGIDPYERFIEMNDIALNIRNSAKTIANA